MDDLQEVVTKLDATGLDMEQAKAFARAASVALKEKQLGYAVLIARKAVP